MPVTVCSRDNIDLHRTTVTDRVKERLALIELQGQIKKWLQDNKYLLDKIYTILINKLVYYSVKEISQVNPGLKISSGWYKYGPCFEAMREREMDQYTFFITETKKGYVEEIAKVCEIEVPLYMNALPDAEKDKYFYKYLQHIYTDKNRMIIPELAGFYPAKHDLAYYALKGAYNPQSMASRDISRLVINFNSEIANTKYMQFIGLDEQTVWKVHDFTFALDELLQANKELNENGKSNIRIDSSAKEMAHRFDEIPLMVFAYKNYLSTYVDVNSDEESNKKSAFNDEVELFTTKTKYSTDDLLSVLQKNWQIA